MVEILLSDVLAEKETQSFGRGQEGADVSQSYAEGRIIMYFVKKMQWSIRAMVICKLSVKLLVGLILKKRHLRMNLKICRGQLLQRAKITEENITATLKNFREKFSRLKSRQITYLHQDCEYVM